ncbi:DUF1289 domain-containing protein [bacterium]|nr:DUF1289 domain-containing protein [bacterium]
MIESPCISECRICEDDICEGCKRTLTEIVEWGRMSEEDKEEVIRRLEKCQKQ